jgi:hypothetical protein
MNEMVEQALVDNLLQNDTFFPHPDMHHHHVITSDVVIGDGGSANAFEPAASNISSGGVSSGNGQANLRMNESEPGLRNDSLTGISHTAIDEFCNVSPPPPASVELNNNLINILIRFVNEKEMRVQAKPNDTILLLKKYAFLIISWFYKVNF